MKKRLLFNLAVLSASVASLAVFVLPIFPYENKGYYNFASNTLYCNSPRGCRHEIGHRMDAERGHPSRSAEFAHAVQLYLYVELHHEIVSDFAMAILTFPPMMMHRVPRFPVSSSGQEELYAEMYTWVEGEIEELPEIFREFYSRDTAYSELYRCLTKPAKLNLCDRSVYISK